MLLNVMSKLTYDFFMYVSNIMSKLAQLCYRPSGPVIGRTTFMPLEYNVDCHIDENGCSIRFKAE